MYNLLLRFYLAITLSSLTLPFSGTAQFTSANDYSLTFFTTEDGLSQGTNSYML
jgi:hypothetical protein